MWLTFVIQNWKLILGAALIAGVGLVAYNKGADSVQAKWDKEKAQIAQELLAHALEVQKDNIKKQEERSENLAKIDSIRADNAALRERLRLPKTCPSPVSGTGAPEDSPAGTGELQPEVPSCAEEALRRFDELWDEESLRADRIVEECRAQ